MSKGDYNKIERQDLEEDILSIFNKNKDNFSRELYIEKGKYSRAPIKRIYGTWNKMLKELNLPLNCTRNEVTKEEVIIDALNIFKKFNKLTALIYRQNGKYSQPIVDRIFGSFTNLLKELNFEPNHISKYLTNEEILFELKKLYDKHGMLSTEIIDNEFLSCYATLINKFGNLSNIYQLLDVVPIKTNQSYFKTAGLVINLISEILNEIPIKEWTTFSLKNPDTDSYLYFDAYFPKNNLILEYHGIQHFQFVEYFHNDLEEFNRRQKIDSFKEEWCKKSSINFLMIKYNDPVEKTFLERKVNENKCNTR